MNTHCCCYAKPNEEIELISSSADKRNSNGIEKWAHNGIEYSIECDMSTCIIFKSNGYEPWGWTTPISALLPPDVPTPGICSTMSLYKETKPNAPQRWRNSNEHVQMCECECVCAGVSQCELLCTFCVRHTWNLLKLCMLLHTLGRA